MDYRKLYCVVLNVKLNTDFDIHHIDENRENNEMSNLVAIPKKLHQDFHLALSNIWPLNTTNKDILRPLSILDSGNRYFIEAVNNLHIYSKYLIEVQQWVDYRNYHLGLIQNIHNLSYEGSNS